LFFLERTAKALPQFLLDDAKRKKAVQGKLQLKTAASPIQGNKGENSTEEKHSHQQNSG
jgi:hypothetical protein